MAKKREDQEIKEAIARNVKGYAFAHSLTMERVALKARMSTSSLYNKLRGRSEWTLKELCSLARVCEMNVVDIMTVK